MMLHSVIMSDERPERVPLNVYHDLIRSTEKRLGRPCRILVIDDMEDCYLLFERVFRGCDLEWVATGEEGIRRLEDENAAYDAVVVDEVLPDRPGRKVIADIRERWEKLLTVMSTGLEFDPKEKQDLLGLGLVLWLAKPIQEKDVKSLLEFIKEHRG